MVSGKVARIIIKKNYLEFLEYLYSDLHISKIVCIFAGENRIISYEKHSYQAVSKLDVGRLSA